MVVLDKNAGGLVVDLDDPTEEDIENIFNFLQAS